MAHRRRLGFNQSGEIMLIKQLLDKIKNIVPKKIDEDAYDDMRPFLTDKIMCIYHGNCADGFGAAVVVNRFYNHGNNDIEWVEGHYGESMEVPDVTDKYVIMVDFSFKRPVLLEMAAKAKQILILDHHKSAELDLVDLPSNVKCVFDMERSGALIAHDYFFPDREAPQLIKHIDDRDRWVWAYPETRNISTALFSYEYDFDQWTNFIFDEIDNPIGEEECRPTICDKLNEEGSILERKHHKDIDETVEYTGHRMEIDGYNIPCVNVPYQWGSDAAHKMYDGTGELFSAYYSIDGNSVKIGLRSDKGGFDVSELATKFGGGGHQSASGLSVSWDDFRSGEKIKLIGK